MVHGKENKEVTEKSEDEQMSTRYNDVHEQFTEMLLVFLVSEMTSEVK